MPDFGIWSEMKFDASFAQFVLWQLQARKTVGRLLSGTRLTLWRKIRPASRYFGSFESERSAFEKRLSLSHPLPEK